MKRKIPYSWPFAIDLLKRQYDANSDKRLMRFRSQYFDSLGANFEINLLGNSGYVSTDPKNVEILLSTRFKGKNTKFIRQEDAEGQPRLWLGIPR